MAKELIPSTSDEDITLVSSLESHLLLLGERVKSLEREKEESNAELRDARVEIELILDEREKLSKSLKKAETALAEAQKLAEERKAAMEAAEERSAELAVSSAKQHEESGNLWQAKASALASELELAKEAIQKAETAAQIALRDIEIAEKRCALAKERENIAIEEARMALAEKDSLQAQTTQVHGEAEQIREENERRSKAFLAAVDAAVGKFRSDLEDERDALQGKYIDSQQAQHDLKQRIDLLGKELLQARKDADETGAQLLRQRELCVEYELAMQNLRQQAESAAQTDKESTMQLKKLQVQWSEAKELLESQKKEVKEQLIQEQATVRSLTDDLAALKSEARRWQHAAGERNAAQAAAMAAEESSRLSREELIAAQAEIRRLQRLVEELDARTPMQDDGAASQQKSFGDFSSVTPPLSGQKQLARRESNFDLELALRQTPLLSTSAGNNALSSTGRTRQWSSRWQLLIGYIALLHVIILVVMGQSAQCPSHHHILAQQSAVGRELP